MAIYSSNSSKIYIISEKNANFLDQWEPPKADFDILECIPVIYDKILWTKASNGHSGGFEGG